METVDFLQVDLVVGPTTCRPKEMSSDRVYLDGLSSLFGKTPMEPQHPTLPRRQHKRLHISCTECRRRKIRCDRSRPCSQCVRGDRAELCHYPQAPGSQERGIQGQLVFEVAPAQIQQHRKERVAHQPTQISGPTHARESVQTGPVVTPLRQFWHGSRAGDRYESPFDGATLVVPKEVIFGEDDATVFWGRTHEANFVPRITDMTTMLLRSTEDDHISTLLEVERHTRPKDAMPSTLDPGLLSLLPVRATADRFWQTYKDHFESYYRVLHVPAFEEEYQHFWTMQQASVSFLPQLLSICAIASSFRDEDRLQREGQIRSWIEAVRLWLFKADPRAQLSLGLLQAHLLMLIAGDVHWMKIDRSWIASGTLIRNAISAGLHREPKDFFRISRYHAECRRRLWYIILEYDLLTCFAKGRTPSIREEEYDCEPPKSTEPGLNDDADEIPYEQHTSVRLAKYLPLRTQVCRAVNSIKLDLDYNDVIRLDLELKGFLRDICLADNVHDGCFKRALTSIMGHRAVIALHAPFVTRALHDPKWSYSRARCLEISSTILSEALTLLDDSRDGDCGPFATISNICRCEISNSVFLICHELLAQTVEQRGLAEHASVVPAFARRWEHNNIWLVELLEKTAAAMNRVSKPDLVSQRTCAWVKLSADLCRATATPTSEGTIAAIKAIIKRGIDSWRSNREFQDPARVDPVEPGLVSPQFMMIRRKWLTVVIRRTWLIWSMSMQL